MQGAKGAVLMGFVLVVFALVAAPCVQAEGVSLLQAIEKVEKEMKMLVVEAATAGGSHHLAAIGNGKTKIIKVCADTGALEVTEERNWTDKSKEICAKAKISCSTAATNAMKECDADLLSLKAATDRGMVKFVVCVESKARGDLSVEVCGCTGKVGSVQSRQEAAEPCDVPEE